MKGQRILALLLSILMIAGSVHPAFYSYAADLLPQENAQAEGEKGDAPGSDDAAKAPDAAEDGPGPLRAPSAPVEKTIQIDLKDLEGNLLTSPDIGTGIEMKVYEFPSGSTPTFSSEEEYRAYLEEMESKGTSFIIDKQAARYTLTMEDDASPNNEYTVIFMVGVSIASGLSEQEQTALGQSAFPPFPIMSAGTNWFGYFSFAYDGTDIRINGTTMTLDSEGIYHGSVYHLGQLPEAEYSMSTDASGYSETMLPDDPRPYPLYMRTTLLSVSMVAMDGTKPYYMPLMSVQTTVTKVEADGSGTVKLPEKVAPSVSGPMPYGSILAVELFMDEACTKPAALWEVDPSNQYEYDAYQGPGLFRFNVAVTADGSIVYFDLRSRRATDIKAAPRFILQPLPDHINTVKLPVTVSRGAWPDDWEESFFPVYMEACLERSGQDSGVRIAPVTAGKMIRSAEDMNTILEFTAPDGQFFTQSGNGYLLSWAFYSDADHTKKLTGFQTELPQDMITRYMGVNARGRLFVYQDIPQAYVSLDFVPLTVDVKPEPLTDEISSDKPLNLRLTIDKTFNYDKTVDSPERTTWNVPYLALAGVRQMVRCEAYDADWAAPRENWFPAGNYDDGGYTFRDQTGGWQSSRGVLLRAQDVEEEKWVLTPYQDDKKAVDVEIPIRVIIPDEVTDCYTFKEQGGKEAAHVMLSRVLPDGTVSELWSDQSHSGADRDVPGQQSYCMLDTDLLDANKEGTIPVGRLIEGRYAVSWYMGNDSAYIQGNQDDKWVIPGEPVYVTVDSEGRVKNEDGTDFVAEFRVKEDFLRKRVHFTIDVETTLPDQYRWGYLNYNYDEFTPRWYRFYLTPAWKDYAQSFALNGYNNRYGCILFRVSGRHSGRDYVGQYLPEGRSVIGSNADHYDWVTYVKDLKHLEQAGYATKEKQTQVMEAYGKTPTIHSFYSYILGPYKQTFMSDKAPGDGFDISSDFWYGFADRDPWKYIEPAEALQGYPVGDYYISYYNDCSDYYRYKWSQEHDVKVHLSDDGKFYRVLADGSLDSEPFVIDIHYIDGGQAPGEKPDKTVDKLTVDVNTYLHNGVDGTDAFTDGDVFKASLVEYWSRDGEYGDTTIAEGEFSITEEGLKTLALESVDGEPLKFYKANNYEIYYHTEHAASGGVSPEMNGDWLSSSAYLPVDGIQDDGTVKDGGGNAMVLSNEYLVLPWSVNSPKSVSAYDGDDGVVLKPITGIGQIQDKSHYMVVVHNEYDDKWYAMANDEEGGWQVELEGIKSAEDLKKGWKISEKGDVGSYVLTANKTNLTSDTTAELQLKTGDKDADGKTVSLKMGVSSNELKPLFSGSAGTVTVKEPLDEGGLISWEIWKGSYARLFYMPEMFGKTGFDTYRWYRGNQYGTYYERPVSYPYADFSYGSDNNAMIYELMTWDDKGYNAPTARMSVMPKWDLTGGASVFREDHDLGYRFQMPAAYTEEGYLSDLKSFLAERNGRVPEDTPHDVRFYILSDNQEEAVTAETKDYTLVKTFGDFVMTYSRGSEPSKVMVLVWKNEDGEEFVLDPEGLIPTQTRAGSGGYRKLSAEPKSELRPNNAGSSKDFRISETLVDEGDRQIFVTDYAFRESALNRSQDKEYLTLTGEAGESAWSLDNDEAGSGDRKYMLVPTEKIADRYDWDDAVSYRLSVLRDGKTSWLGVAEDDGKLRMVIADSEEDAAVFTVYSDNVSRYYSSAYGSDLYSYYKISSIEDINEGDEIIIVNRDSEGVPRILSSALVESYRWSYPQSTVYEQHSEYAAVEVLDEYSTVDSRDAVFPENVVYKYRFDTDEYTKKPFAHFEDEDQTVIRAQGITANVIGKAKKEDKKQRKYASVQGLGTGEYIYVRSYEDIYYRDGKEVVFYPAGKAGEFWIRGSSNDYWAAMGYYTRTALNTATGRYVSVGTGFTFEGVDQEHRETFEIYRRASSESFKVRYNDADGSVDHTEIKPKDGFALTQKTDEEKDGTEYVFVGWTADPDKKGYLSLNDSANLFDYDKRKKVAYLKKDAHDKFSLLGPCDPDDTNLIEYSEIEEFVKDGVLDVYPVYAVRGFSRAVTANDGDTMIIGIADFKDSQMGGDGTPGDTERWLGSIDIRIFKDGKPWVANSGAEKPMGLFAARRALRAGLKAAPEVDQASAKLYFAYHNDDAADLNIKFIEEGVTAAMLEEYMDSDAFDAKEPTEKYVIDAVYASQGGSEDGLKFRYNWMDKTVGGQLDNVEGGSVVEVYVTTKYQVKYYFDQGEGYEQLTGDQWTDEGFYATEATEKAVNRLIESAGYDITPESTGDLAKLMNRTAGDTTTFKDENMERGGYSTFLYRFDTYPHIIDIAGLPEAPQGKFLAGDKWTVKKSAADGDEPSPLEQLADVSGADQAPETKLTVGAAGGSDSDNTVWTFKAKGDET
ncbi:MAG: hypothetical protein IJK25_03760, partial [Firmicutes bacterium]|nr:hypothetical protein [Bacillota bacterium]